MALVIACPLGLWAVLATVGQDNSVPHVGQVVSVEHTGVALSKPALLVLIREARTRNRAVMASLVSRGQILVPPVGTAIKIKYIELFHDDTIYQVEILSGKYKGRTGWLAEQQIHWPTPPVLKHVPLPTDDNDMQYDLPAGLDSGFDSTGVDRSGDLAPDKQPE